MNKKGFTLLEIMSVVIIIGILLLIAVPSITRNIVGAKKAVYKQHEKTIETMAKSYMNECMTHHGVACSLPAKGQSVKMLLSDFVNLGMVRNGLEDPEGRPKYCDGEDTFVVVKNNAKESNSYDLTYEVCLSCSTYKSGFCATYTSTPVCTTCPPPTCGTIELENTTWTNKEVTVGVRCVGHGANCLRDVFYEKVTTNGQKVNVTIRDEANKTAICPVNAYVDRVAPTVGIQLANTADSSESLDGWTRGITRVEMTTLTDTLSGVNTWGMGTSKTPDFNKLKIFNAEDGVSAVYGYGKDNAGNVGGLDNAIEIKRDNQAPTISAVDLGYQVYPAKPELSTLNVNKVEINSRLAEFGAIKGIKIFFSSNPSGSEIIVYDNNVEVNRVNQGATYNVVDLPVPSKIYNNMQITFTNGQETRITRIEVIVEKQVGFYTNKDLNVYVEAFDLLSTVRDYSFDGGVTWQTNVDKKYTANTPTTSPVNIIVRDRAGNKTSFGSFHITNIDKTAPTCTLKQTGTVGVSSWYRTPVTVSYSATSDALSGVRDYSFNTNGEGNPKTKLQSTDTSGTTYTGYILDKAGNVGSCATTVKLDQVKPTCTLTPSGTMGTNSWYTANVTVTRSAQNDERSGVYQTGIAANSTVNYTGGTALTHTVDGTSITYYGFVKDNAGNEGVCSVTFKKDATKPTCTLAADAAPTGLNSWYIVDIPMTLTRNDVTSGVAAFGLARTTAAYNNLATATESTATTGVTWRGIVKDNAGNEGVCSLTVKLDKTNPTCSVSFTGTAGTNGWLKSSPATVNLTRADSISGVKAYGLTTSTTATYNTLATGSQVNTAAAGAKWYGYVQDNAGRTVSCSNTVYVDAVAPVCGAVGGGRTTWLNTNVSVNVACSDANSGCTSSTFATTATAEAKTQSLTITISDKAGNTKACTNTHNTYIDKTAPWVSWTTDKYPVSGYSFYSTPLVVSGTCNDALSGVSGTAVGSTTFYTGNGQTTSKYCVDVAGNAATRYSGAYTVKYWGTHSACGCASYYSPIIGYNQVCVEPIELIGQTYICPSSWDFQTCYDDSHIPGCTTWTTENRYGAQVCSSYYSCWLS